MSYRGGDGGGDLLSLRGAEIRALGVWMQLRTRVRTEIETREESGPRREAEATEVTYTSGSSES